MTTGQVPRGPVPTEVRDAARRRLTRYGLTDRSAINLVEAAALTRTLARRQDPAALTVSDLVNTALHWLDLT